MNDRECLYICLKEYTTLDDKSINTILDDDKTDITEVVNQLSKAAANNSFWISKFGKYREGRKRLNK